MKRELIFRAFIDGTMYYNHSVTIQIDGTISYLTHLGDWIDDEEGIVKIMQSTGLKDKNGTTIFEGDVIKKEFREFTVVFENGQFIGWHQSKKIYRCLCIQLSFYGL